MSALAREIPERLMWRDHPLGPLHGRVRNNRPTVAAVLAALDDEQREALADRVHEHIQSLVIDMAIDARAIVDALCGGPDA